MFFGVIVEKDDDDDDEGQKLKSIEDEFYGDESQGVQVKVRISTRFSTHFHVDDPEQHRHAKTSERERKTQYERMGPLRLP